MGQNVFVSWWFSYFYVQFPLQYLCLGIVLASHTRCAPLGSQFPPLRLSTCGLTHLCNWGSTLLVVPAKELGFSLIPLFVLLIFNLPTSMIGSPFKAHTYFNLLLATSGAPPGLRPPLSFTQVIAIARQILLLLCLPEVSSQHDSQSNLLKTVDTICITPLFKTPPKLFHYTKSKVHILTMECKTHPLSSLSLTFVSCFSNSLSHFPPQGRWPCCYSVRMFFKYPRDSSLPSGSSPI